MCLERRNHILLVSDSMGRLMSWEKSRRIPGSQTLGVVRWPRFRGTWRREINSGWTEQPIQERLARGRLTDTTRSDTPHPKNLVFERSDDNKNPHHRLWSGFSCLASTLIPGKNSWPPCCILNRVLAHWSRGVSWMGTCSGLYLSSPFSLSLFACCW